MLRPLILACLLLTACSDGPQPTPLPQHAPPRPGHLVGSADWHAPIGLQPYCGGPGHSSPFSCNVPIGTVWGTSPWEGRYGLGCGDPEPNACFPRADGVLGYDALPIGMSMVRLQTLPRSATISVEAVVTATNGCNSPDVSFVGPVIYDGEGAIDDPTGNYRALYLTCQNNGPGSLAGKFVAQLFGPTYAGPISDAVYVQGSTHTLRIDYVPGISFTYIVDDDVVLTETFGYSADSLSFTQDPHPGLWFGNSVGTIGRFDWYSGS